MEQQNEQQKVQQKEQEKHSILIVSNTPGYLVAALGNHLSELEYDVKQSKVSTDELNRVMEATDAIFIFMDDDVLACQQGLIYLKDVAVEGDIPIFVTGDAQECKSIQSIIPTHLIYKFFPRPINVNEVAGELDTYMKTAAKHNRKKILVVDDSGAMLRNVKGWLEDKYQVVLANSGAMAIKYLSTNRPDLVLLDYEMPIIDGKQVLAMIRSEVEFSDIPVIFLTSKGDKESVLQVMALKPDGYLLKTMPPEDIKKSVDDFFIKRKAMGK